MHGVGGTSMPWIERSGRKEGTGQLHEECVRERLWVEGIAWAKALRREELDTLEEQKGGQCG